MNIDVTLEVVTAPLHKKTLEVLLTQDEDPFFLYSLKLGEGDFQQ